MDIYGAFQLCSIGILAAPLTVRLSRTYFYDPGRNIIFLWTLLILAGLLGLTVEFYRATPTDCGYDDAGQPIARNPKQFPYGKATCGMVCSPDQGPQSPMRQGPSNDIGVIPIPSKLTFNTGMLLAAACCIPAILSLMFTWDKILEINWKMRHRDAAEDQRMDELIEGTNGATVQKMKDVNSMVRFLLGVIEIPLFGGAVLAILCIGEINFFSAQVMYQTEEIASIGTSSAKQTFTLPPPPLTIHCVSRSMGPHRRYFACCHRLFIRPLDKGCGCGKCSRSHEWFRQSLQLLASHPAASDPNHSVGWGLFAQRIFAKS